MNKSSAQKQVAPWMARIAVAIVFVINVQCACAFIFFPDHYLASYGLSGIAGSAAIQGIGVCFLMWNVTYPLVIFKPDTYQSIFAIVLIQQIVGLLGESFIYFSLGSTQSLLANSIMRFIIFDGAGLIAMGLTFLFLKHHLKAQNAP